MGGGVRDVANINNIGVACGLVYGTARRLDGSSAVFETGSNLFIPIYSCASAVKAVVKKVHFQFNGTEGLKSLKVLQMEDKVYPNEKAMPLWGVENSGMARADINPLWGLLSDKYENWPGVSTMRKESLWLPASAGIVSRGIPINPQYSPGADFHGSTSSVLYLQTGGIPMLRDHTGVSDTALHNKWQKLSRTAEGTATVMNLIWTDIAANLVLGSKGLVGATPLRPGSADGTSSSTGAASSARYEVRMYAHRIRLKKIWYAIPAMIVLCLWLAFSAAALALWAARCFDLALMRVALQRTSPGRILTTFLFPDDCPSETSTKDWVRLVGSRRLDFRSNGPPRPLGDLDLPSEAWEKNGPMLDVGQRGRRFRARSL